MSGRLKVWDGSAWQYVGKDGAAGATGASGATTFARLYDGTLGADAATVDTDPSSLSGYTHLKIILNVRAVDNAARQAFLRFNNDSGSNYSWASPNVGAGTGLGTSSTIGQIVNAADAANCWSIIDLTVSDYANTSRNKTYGGCRSSGDTGTAAFNGSELLAGAWASTSAITRITIGCSSGNFLAGTRFTVYGML